VYKVVLVDDEPKIIDGLKAIVPWDEYKCQVVAIANSAQQGRDKISQHNPDILFTDVSMPGEDGLTMLAGLRSQYPSMQVIILSGYSSFDYAQRAIRLGVCRYLLKPSKMRDIKDAVLVAITNLKGECDDVKDEIKPSNFVLAKAVEYVKKNFKQKLTLHIVADKCYVSHWHLSKLLNTKLNKNFYTLLNEVRIEKAKELLSDASNSVRDVCDEIGYGDCAHFSRVFKNTTGMTASEYREKHKW